MDVARENSIKLDVPVGKIPKEKVDILLYGMEKNIKFTYESKSKGSTYEYEGKFEGVIPQLERLFYQTESEGRKDCGARNPGTNSKEQDFYLGVFEEGSWLGSLTRPELWYQCL